MPARFRWILALLIAIATSAIAAEPPFDILITNAHIVDGTGSPWYSGDVGIRSGRIAAIGKLAGQKTKRTIDAKGRVVAPGFIDMLGQSELTILVNPHLPSKIYQGITTEITGEGQSAGPLNDAILKADKTGYDHLGIVPDWRTLGGYFARGMWADVVVFDPETVRDLATFENPNQLSVGMDYVLVNGVLVIDSGKMTNALPGKVLRGAGYVQYEPQGARH